MPVTQAATEQQVGQINVEIGGLSMLITLV